MSVAVFTIKRRDTSPALLYRVPAINFAEASVVFNMRSGEVVLLNRAPALFADARTFRYDWQPGDLPEAGQFEGEFEVTYSDGAVETFPNDGFIVISVTEDIA